MLEKFDRNKATYSKGKETKLDSFINLRIFWPVCTWSRESEGTENTL